MHFNEFIRRSGNADLAKALDYLGKQMRGGISDAILKEAAKRLRNQPDPSFVTSPEPELPPLKAYAEIET